MRIPRRFLIGADGEPRLWWHWQNLNTEHVGRRERVKGSGLWHGRAWLHAGDPWGRGGPPMCLRVEWLLGRLGFGASLEVGGHMSDGDGLAASLSLPGARVYLSAESGPFGRLARWIRGGAYDGREVSLRVHSGSVWWLLWVNDDERRYPRRFWDRVRAGSFTPVDALLGRQRYASTDLEERDVEVPMPERTYRGVARLHEDEWRRPRWPVPARLRRVTIEMREGEQVPHPGKGENGWDLDEDATFSITTRADSIEEGVGHLVASVLRYRRRYGGADWRPAAAASA